MVQRSKQAEEGLSLLKEFSDSMIVVPNEKLHTTLNDISMLDAFVKANDVLLNAVKGISEVILKTGMMNLDFADVRTIMSEMGMAMMGTGEASGENRASEAMMKAISSPLLDDLELKDAKGILINITAASSFNLQEFREISDILNGLSGKDATVISGTVFDDSLGDVLRVTVIATGIERHLSAPQEGLTVAFSDEAIDFDEKKVEDRSSMVVNGSTFSDQVTHSKDFDLLDIPSFIRRQAD